MRTLLLTALLALSIHCITLAQLSYLGTDKLPRGPRNPYSTPELAGGIVELNGDFFFTTPTGTLYRTDGTEAGTKAVYAAQGQSLPILAATGKFLYIGVQNPGYASYMHVYVPGSSGLRALRQQNPAEAFRFNNNRLPGYNAMADDLAVSPDRKHIVFRNFIHDAISLNVISDYAPEAVKMAKYCSPGELENKEQSIYILTDIGFVRNEIFVNGNERDLLTAAFLKDGNGDSKFERTGNRAFSTSSVMRNPEDTTKWYIGSYYHLDSRGYTLYKGLYRSRGELYSLVSKQEGKTVGEHQLVHYDSARLLLSRDKLPGGHYYTAEVHDDLIYLLTTGNIYRYDSDADRFRKAFSDTGSGFNPVFDNDLVLKSGKYLLTRIREQLLLIDESTGKAVGFKCGKPQDEPNRFSFGERYAWATKRAFYVIDTDDGTPIFTRISPESQQKRAIPMPPIDKAEFTKFRAVFQLGDRFLLLTEYRGRKGLPVFNMFMYRDEAS